MFLLWIIEEMPPGVRFWLVYIGPGGGGFELFFCPGGGEFAHQKDCLEVLPGGDGQAWN